MTLRLPMHSPMKNQHITSVATRALSVASWKSTESMIWQSNVLTFKSNLHGQVPPLHRDPRLNQLSKSSKCGGNLAGCRGRQFGLAIFEEGGPPRLQVDIWKNDWKIGLLANEKNKCLNAQALTQCVGAPLLDRSRHLEIENGEAARSRQKIGLQSSTSTMASRSVTVG